MMKIAVLSDIHGNHLALEKVLFEAEEERVEYLLVLGDMVGYYYHPDRVLDLLKAWPHLLIQGNHERLLKTALNDPAIARSVRKKYGSGIDMALEKLSTESLLLLIELPCTQKITWGGITFFLCHGSPWDGDQYIYPDSGQSLIDRCMVPGCDFILMGHTHYPLLYKKQDTIIANPGSVGQSRAKGGTADWALIDTDQRTIAGKSTYFDILPLIEEVSSKDPEVPYLWQVLLRNRNC